MRLLLRVKFDDKLFVDIEIDLIALGKSENATLQLFDVDLKPCRNLYAFVGNESALDYEKFLSLGANSHKIAGAYAEGRDVYATAIDLDVAMGNDLTSFLAGLSEAKTEYNVVETRLEDAHKVFTGNAGHSLSALEVTTELLLQNAVDELRLLLFTELHAVFGFLATTLGLTDGFLLAAITHNSRIQTELATTLENRSPVNCHSESILSNLDATTLALTATVVRDRGAILDASDFEAGCLKGTDSGFATGTGTLHEDGNLLQAVLHSGLSSCFSCHLSSEGRGLTRALEAYGASGLPGNYIALRIRDGNDSVVESRFDMRSANCDVLALRALKTRANVLLSCHCLSLLLLAADLTLGTLAGTSVRVSALTANGQTTTMTKTTIATDFHEALDILRNFAVQVTFGGEVLLDIVAELGEFVFRNVLDASVRVDTGFGQDLLRGGKADAVNVGQADFNALVARKVDTNETCHSDSSLSF